MSEPLPRLLLVEDEPVVRAFLAAALDGLPLVLDLAGSAADACRLAQEHAPALLLLDLNLPDGDGVRTLQALRAAGLACPAVALTADTQACLQGPLAAAGFAGVAHKPIARDALRQLVARWLPGTTPAGARSMPPDTPPDTNRDGVAEPRPGALAQPGELPDWDDGAALTALAGRDEILEVLRNLLRSDLPGQLATIEQSVATDPAQGCAVLHRLQAAAGFCGAARLGAAARALESALQRGTPAADALQALRDACATVLAPAEA